MLAIYIPLALMGVLVAAVVLSKQLSLSSEIIILLFFSTAALGLLGIVTCLDRLVPRRMYSATALRWLLVSAGFLLIFYSRLESIADINKIFQIDANALPLTTVMATGMHCTIFIAYIFLWGGVGTLVVILISMLFQKARLRYAGKWPALICLLGFYFVAAGVILVFAARMDDPTRLDIIYRLALRSDFVEHFSCSTRDKSASFALLIGPEQRRVIFAPKIEEPHLDQKQVASIFRRLSRPEKFQVSECLQEPGASS